MFDLVYRAPVVKEKKLHVTEARGVNVSIINKILINYFLRFKDELFATFPKVSATHVIVYKYD